MQRAIVLPPQTVDVITASKLEQCSPRTIQRKIAEISMPQRMLEKGAVAEAIEALMALGYNAPDAQRAIAAVSDSADTVDKLVFMALRGMDNG